MKIKHFRIFFAFLLAVVIFVLPYISTFTPLRQKSPGQYSVILYQYTDNDWSSLLEGIRQAEEDEGVVVNYVTTTLGGSPEHELELIKREIENGAEGILLAPVDSEAMEAEVEQLSKTTPVITLETGLGTKSADISGDNYDMGYLLGEQVAADMKQTGEQSVCVIKEYTERQSVLQRFQGFSDAINAEAPMADIQEYHRSEGDFSLPVCIANMYEYSIYGSYVVSLDKYCTEALIEAAGYPESTSNENNLLCQRAFGIGNTEKTVSALDSGILKGLVYQNEFNIGYQGLQLLIQKKKSDADTEIRYYYVTRDTLYDSENERLLFPLK